MELALIVTLVLFILFSLSTFVGLIMFLRYCDKSVKTGIKNLTDSAYIEITIDHIMLWDSIVFEVSMDHDDINRIETSEYEIRITKDKKIKVFKYYSCNPSFIVDNEEDLEEFERFKKEFYKRYEEVLKNNRT